MSQSHATANVRKRAKRFHINRLWLVSARPFCLLVRSMIWSIAGCLHDPVPGVDGDVRSPVRGVEGADMSSVSYGSSC